MNEHQFDKKKMQQNDIYNFDPNNQPRLEFVYETLLTMVEGDTLRCVMKFLV